METKRFIANCAMGVVLATKREQRFIVQLGNFHLHLLREHSILGPARCANPVDRTTWSVLQVIITNHFD